MKDDSDLLRAFAEEGDDRAFRAVVDRHIALVYSSALRQVNGDAHLAADVTQEVFTDLARKARSLIDHRVLAGWLFTSTRFAAAKMIRTEQRRRRREEEARRMDELNHDHGAALEWSRARPVIDTALGELTDSDREAILLRYFEHRDYRDIGDHLGCAENTARMRVERALDKLRAVLERRGVTSTTLALAAALAAEAVSAAPIGLAATTATAALSGAGALSWWGVFMSMTKLQVGLTGALAVASATGFAVQARSNATLRDEVAALRQETAALPEVRKQNLQLGRQAAEVAMLREDGAAFTRMSEEAADLKQRLQNVVKLQAQQAAALARSGAPIDVAKLDMLPVARVRKPPQYPFELRTAGIPGEVVVDFVVDSDGNVQNARAVKSSRPEFEPAAVQAISEWKFRPGRKGGRNVNTHMQVPIVFSLNEAGASPGGMKGLDAGAADPVPVPALPKGSP